MGSVYVGLVGRGVWIGDRDGDGVVTDSQIEGCRSLDGFE